MIQRVQTLYFLALILSSLSMMFCPLVFFKVTGPIGSESFEISVSYAKTSFHSTTENNIVSNHPLFLMIGAIAALSLICIFSFKNRRLQAILTAFNFIPILSLLYFMYAYSFGMNYIENEGELQIAALMPLALLLFNFLGLRGIRNDEKLIRSIDRLR